MKKIKFNILVAIACLLCGVNIYAYDFKVDGICYNIYSPADMTVEVTSPGDREEYSNSYYRIPESVVYNGKTYTVVRIGDFAFNDSELKKVKIPNTVKTIGENAFGFCSMEAIEIPNSVISLGDGVFWYSNIKRIIISSNVINIGYNAFKGCICSELFMLPIDKPEGFVPYYDIKEIYVLDKERYSGGDKYIQMVSVSPDTLVYNGQIPEFDCINNLKGYDCRAVLNVSEYNVGTYEATIDITYSNGLSLSLEMPFEYTILPAPLTVDVNSVNRVYGEDNPKFTYSLAGFVNNETLESIGGEVLLTTDATHTSDVGEYPITGTIIDMPNYSATFVDGKLSVTKAPASVKVIDSSRIYGDKNPNFNVKYEGLKNNEKSIALTTPHTFATDAVKSSDVGEYVVAVSGGVAKNYDFVTYKDGVLHIDKRELIVTANNYSRKYNEDNPTFDFTYSNFASFDEKDVLEVEPRIYCSATPKSPAGDYPIIVSGGEDNNYDFRYNVGNLTVEQIILNFKKEKNQTYFTNTPQCPEIVVDGNLEIENIDDILDAYQEYGSNEDGRGWVNISLNSVVNVGEYRFDLSVNNDSLFADATTYLTILKAYPNLEWNQYIDKMKIGDRIILEYSTTVGKPVVICDYDILGVGYDTELERYYLEALKEGTTDVTMYVKETNNYYESERITKTVCVEPIANQHDIINTNIRVYGSKNSIYISNKADSDFVYVYDVNGYLLYSGKEKIVPIGTKGLYIVKVENQVFKVVI